MLSIPEDVSSEVFKGVKARHGTRQLHGAIIPGVFPLWNASQPCQQPLSQKEKYSTHPISPMRVSHFLGL